ncbi:RNA-guided endonuclease TnpB family protein [Candidatus Borrarchaeum sp.]|uniref:RNA-guided endonuclease InsQ/TnpB family protein n=1 Tax=Candidatus Borrarchaeum sp. TaxID=2846742 RepID=UPI00257C979C|nr:RNA-guided endonuclease TnpB family protein [Candidatus Borrarchaeum sp.]
MKRTYRYRLYPTTQQATTLTQWLTTCRLLYNNGLAERKNAWETYKKSVTYGEQANQLKGAKKTNQFLQAVHSQVLQDTLRRLDKTFNNFFRRIKKGEKAGYPRFKGKYRYDSFTYPQSGFTLDYRKKKLRLSKIGAITIKLHRPIPSEGVIKTCTIKRDVDHWYACFSVELPNHESQRKLQKAIGVDVGLKSLLTLNNGETIANPRWLRTSEKKVAKEQRRKDRKVKGSNNRYKQNKKVAQVHRKIHYQRKDFHHKLSRKLVDNYDLIVYENLKITNMVKNHHVAKSISDAGWGQLMCFTEYKAEEAGTLVEYVSAYNTTQLCSQCGKLVPKTLATRIHSCPYCGLVLARDHNSAITVLHRSTRYIESLSSSGQELPVEPG